MQTEYIYLSGAGLRGWIWDTVQQQGLPGVVVDFTSAYDSLQAYVDEALRQIGDTEGRQFIIVMHSIGGVIGSELCGKLGDTVVGVVAVSAVVPAAGQSFVSSLPFPQKLIMPLLLRLAGTKPPEASLRGSLCKGLDTSLQDRIVKDFRTEGKGLYLDKTTAAIPSDMPLTYVVTTSDSEFTAQYQQSQAKPFTKARTVSIDSGHMPMLSHSAELAAAIKSAQQPV